MRSDRWYSDFAARFLLRLALILLGVIAARGVWGWIDPPPAEEALPPVAVTEARPPQPRGQAEALRSGRGGTDELGGVRPRPDAALPAPPLPPLPDPDAPLRPAAPDEPPSAAGAEGLEQLRRRLLMPLPGIGTGDLVDSFTDPRGSSRVHEALDIPAPRNTPVLAVDEGTIARLFESRLGGLTIYQFDAGETYAFYYAHLERYRDGLEEGDRVRRGEVIGYVGTSGNAPADVPHLHFAIYRLGPEKRWWEGEALNPFLVLGP